MSMYIGLWFRRPLTLSLPRDKHVCGLDESAFANFHQLPTIGLGRVIGSDYVLSRLGFIANLAQEGV